MRRLLWLVAVAGCYNPPRPDCGFVCGESGACPADYACDSHDNRCHRVGAPDSVHCPNFTDAGADPDLPADIQGPMVVSVTPGISAIGVAVSTSVSAVFDEEVVNAVTGIRVLDGVGVQIPGMAFYTPVARVVAFDPQFQLLANTQYTAILMSSITDGTGHPLDGGSYTWQFTTGADAVAPHLASTSPMQFASNVPITTKVRLDFDEPVNGVDLTSFNLDIGGTPVPGTIAINATGVTATFTPDADLPAASTIRVNLTNAIVDNAGNPLAAGNFTFDTQ